MLKINFLIIYTIFISVIVADSNTIFDKENSILLFKKVLNEFTILSGNEIEKININFTPSNSSDYIENKYLSIRYRKKYFSWIDFKRSKQCDFVSNLNYLKKFSSREPIDILESLNKLLFEKNVDMSRYKFENKYRGEQDEIVYISYNYVYQFNDLIIRPKISNKILLSENNQLLFFSYHGFPNIKNNKVILTQDEAKRKFRKEFKRILKTLSKDYIFNKSSLKENFNEWVYCIPSQVFKSIWKEFQSNTYSNNIYDYEKTTAELCYEMEFQIKGNFLGTGSNKEIYSSLGLKKTHILKSSFLENATKWIKIIYYKLFYEKEIPDIKKVAYKEMIYTFRLWINPETGQFCGGEFFFKY